MAKNKQQKFKDLLSFKNTIQPTKEELLNQSSEQLSLQNQFSKTLWDDWCRQLI